MKLGEKIYQAQQQSDNTGNADANGNANASGGTGNDDGSINGEYEEKKSRFIATLRPVSTPEEAASFFDEMKKKYWPYRLFRDKDYFCFRHRYARRDLCKAFSRCPYR